MLVAQLVLQVPVVPHAYGAQLDITSVVGQATPPPGHVRAAVRVEPVHVGAAHCVPAP